MIPFFHPSIERCTQGPLWLSTIVNITCQKLSHETSVKSKTKKVKYQFDLTRCLPKSPHTRVPYFPCRYFHCGIQWYLWGLKGVHRELEKEQYMEVTWSCNKGELDIWRNNREHPGVRNNTRSFVKWRNGRVRCQNISFVVYKLWHFLCLWDCLVLPIYLRWY